MFIGVKNVCVLLKWYTACFNIVIFISALKHTLDILI